VFSFQRNSMRSDHAVGTQTSKPRTPTCKPTFTTSWTHRQNDRHDLGPVAFIAFVTMPASLHHHIGKPPTWVEIAPQHMT